MLVASTDLLDTDTVESRNFERSTGLRALLWVKTTLPVVIIATTDHISVTRQEQRMRAAAAHLDDLFFKNIEGLEPNWHVRLQIVVVTELAILIAAP